MKQAFYISLVFLLAIQLYSCKEESLTNTEPKSIIFNNPYSIAGKLHNEGLDSCLSYIRKNIDCIKSKEDLQNISEQGVKEFLRKRNLYLNQDIYQMAMSFCQTRYNKMGKNNGENKITTYDFSTLGYSDSQIIYMQRLFSLFYSTSDLTIIKDSINSISSEVFLKLNTNEAQPILITSSIMLSSLEYWYTHLDEMYQLIMQLINNSVGKIAKDPIDWIEVGLADAEGAAAAAIPCIWVGPAWLECVGGAAIGASMWNATVQLIAWFISLVSGN